MDLTVCCADVGSVAAGNFGWALRDYPGPLHEVPAQASIAELADAVEARLRAGRPVALGFECPLFVPLRDDPAELTRARRGEGNRAWSAGAGSGSLATGLVEVTWLLTRLRRALEPPPALTVSWDAFTSGPGGLFVWEAFVTRGAKVGSHYASTASPSRRSAGPSPTPRAPTRSSSRACSRSSGPPRCGRAGTCPRRPCPPPASSCPPSAGCRNGPRRAGDDRQRGGRFKTGSASRR